jgi:hypothetical protein
VFVTVKYASRNSTADHHAATTASPHPHPTRSAEPSPRGVSPPTTTPFTCTDEVFGRDNADHAAGMLLSGSALQAVAPREILDIVTGRFRSATWQR